MVYSDDRTMRGKGRERGRQDETEGYGRYLHEIGLRESLAHSVDYVDPQVGPFPMAERSHNLAIADNVGSCPVIALDCFRAILE